VRALLEQWLPHGSFARHVSILTGGTVIAQGLAFLALPVLTRLYTPEDFSLFAIYTSALGIIATVASGRYNLAITMPRDDEDALAVLCVALLCALATTALVSLAILIIPGLPVSWINEGPAAYKNAVQFMWLLPSGVLAYGAYDAIQYWTSRKRRFDTITRTRITRAVGGVTTQLAWGTTSTGPLGLLVGHVVYGALGIIALVRDLMARDRALLGSLTWDGCKRQARAFRRFPILSVPEALLNVIGLHLPIIMIGLLIPGSEAGQLMLAMTVIGAPMALIGSSVSQVYISEAPDRLRDGTLNAFTRRTMWTMFKYSAPLLLLMGLVSPFAFPLIFGQEWAQAGWLLLWMTPWFVVQFVASPLSTVLLLLELQGTALMVQLLGVVIRLGAVYISFALHPNWVSETYAVSGLLLYVVMALAVIRSIVKIK
jgi:O-antigen/teichoic acid export membrane protein